MAVWLWALAAWAGGLDGALSEMASLQSQRLAGAVPVIPAEAYLSATVGSVTTGLENVDGSPIKKAWGIGVVDVPIDRMWAAINDERSKPTATRLAHFELLDGEFCAERRVVFQYLAVTLASDRWWVVEQRANKGLAQSSEGRLRELTWRTVDGGESLLNDTAKEWAEDGIQVPFTEGAWMLADVGEGKTLVEYFAWSDPGGSIPAGLASRFAAGGIEDTIGAMADLARRGPTCPKGP